MTLSAVIGLAVRRVSSARAGAMATKPPPDESSASSYQPATSTTTWAVPNGLLIDTVPSPPIFSVAALATVSPATKLRVDTVGMGSSAGQMVSQPQLRGLGDGEVQRDADGVGRDLAHAGDVDGDGLTGADRVGGEAGVEHPIRRDGVEGAELVERGPLAHPGGEATAHVVPEGIGGAVGVAGHQVAGERLEAHDGAVGRDGGSVDRGGTGIAGHAGAVGAGQGGGAGCGVTHPDLHDRRGLLLLGRRGHGPGEVGLRREGDPRAVRGEVGLGGVARLGIAVGVDADHLGRAGGEVAEVHLVRAAARRAAACRRRGCRPSTGTPRLDAVGVQRREVAQTVGGHLVGVHAHTLGEHRGWSDR